MKKPCDIHDVGKRRDGRHRYWCMEYKADATGKYGKKLEKCRKADFQPILEDEIHTLDLDYYKGGVALWGAVPASYDTTPWKVDRGIHLHVRKEVGGKKIVDRTFRQIVVESNDLSLEITEEDAIYYMTSLVMGYPLKTVLCNHCGYNHLDKDVLAVNVHRKHLCAGCGRDFYDKTAGIGNPMVELKKKLGDPEMFRHVKATDKKLNISQADYQGGIQLWGSNQAIIWTSPLLEEEGIHVHCFDQNGTIQIDDTYGKVSIDGHKLDSQMVRFFMAQSSLPHLQGSIVSLKCPECKTPHFDQGQYAHKLHVKHKCEQCACVFEAPSRKKKTISNPITDLFITLEKHTDKVRKSPFIDFLTEGS